MLERQAVECFRIIDGSEDSGSSPVLQVGQYFLPDFDDEVASTAASSATVLVVLDSHLLTGPLKYITLHNFTDQHRTRYVAEGVECLRAALLRYNRNVFCLPDFGPYSGGCHLIEDISQWHRKEVAKLRHELREHVAGNHRFRLPESFEPGGHLMRCEGLKLPPMGGWDLARSERLELTRDPIEVICEVVGCLGVRPTRT